VPCAAAGEQLERTDRSRWRKKSTAVRTLLTKEDTVQTLLTKQDTIQTLLTKQDTLFCRHLRRMAFKRLQLSKIVLCRPSIRFYDWSSSIYEVFYSYVKCVAKQTKWEV
jgi:hypothetical protein